MPQAQAGDDKVTKFVGTAYVEGDSVEAGLDIQFIMGVADGTLQSQGMTRMIKADDAAIQGLPLNSGRSKVKTFVQTYELPWSPLPWSSITLFCWQLNKYTTLLQSKEDCPLVNSISYGWQGDLAQLQCTDGKLLLRDCLPEVMLCGCLMTWLFLHQLTCKWWMRTWPSLLPKESVSWPLRGTQVQAIPSRVSSFGRSVSNVPHTPGSLQ